MFISIYLPKERQRSNVACLFRYEESSASVASSLSSSSETSRVGDFSPDDYDNDPDFQLPLDLDQEEIIRPSSENDPAENIWPSSASHPEVPPASKRRRKGVINSKKKMVQNLRNTGKEYQSLAKSKKVVPARRMGPFCSDKCRLSCSEKINEDERSKIFENYCNLASLMRQRDYIRSCLTLFNWNTNTKRLIRTANQSMGFILPLVFSNKEFARCFSETPLGLMIDPLEQ